MLARVVSIPRFRHQPTARATPTLPFRARCPLFPKVKQRVRSMKQAMVPDNLEN
jgi:hypothetical protein